MPYAQDSRSGDVTSHQVPSQQLEKLVRIAFVWGVLFCVASTSAPIGGFLLVMAEGDASGTVIFTVIGVALFFFTSLIGYGVQVAKWIKLAWETLTRLRNITPRVSAEVASNLAIVPFINYIALIFIMDFLVVRSKSKEEKTMGIWSVASKDPQVTAFAYVSSLSFASYFVGFSPTLTKALKLESIPFTIAEFSSK